LAPRHGRGYAIGGLAQQDRLRLPPAGPPFLPSWVPAAARAHILLRPPHVRDATPKGSRIRQD